MTNHTIKAIIAATLSRNSTAKGQSRHPTLAGCWLHEDVRFHTIIAHVFFRNVRLNRVYLLDMTGRFSVITTKNASLFTDPVYCNESHVQLWKSWLIVAPVSVLIVHLLACSRISRMHKKIAEIVFSRVKVSNHVLKLCFSKYVR